MTVLLAPGGSRSPAADQPTSRLDSRGCTAARADLASRDHRRGAQPDNCVLPCPSWGALGDHQASPGCHLRRWLSAQQGPVLLGADANTPKVDAVDFAATRRWWHSGDPRLNGEPGEDLLFGPGKIHPLEDGLRRWRESSRRNSRPSRPADRPAGDHPPHRQTKELTRNRPTTEDGRPRGSQEGPDRVQGSQISCGPIQPARLLLPVGCPPRGAGLLSRARP